MKQLLMVLMLAVAFTGCQKAKNSTRVSVGGDVRANGLPAGSRTTPAGTSLSAAVVSSSSQSDFEIGVRGLLEAQVPKEYVGSVSPSADDGTGVWIGTKINLQNGQAIGTYNGSVSVASNSEILISVYDSFYTQNGLAQIPPIYIKQATGTISGNYATIKFTDAYGFIELSGQFDNSYFYATVSYDTQRTHDGRLGSYGTLGSVTLPKCQVFRCQ